jgi:hypothetical protein
VSHPTQNENGAKTLEELELERSVEEQTQRDEFAEYKRQQELNADPDRAAFEEFKRDKAERDRANRVLTSEEVEEERSKAPKWYTTPEKFARDFDTLMRRHGWTWPDASE